jgi:DNA-binding transcriptional LysR family regulator
MAQTLREWDNRIGRRLRLRDLHILSVVVEHGSMAKAAAHLAMSQPAVSEAIASLENALQVRLLDRHSTGIEPTVYAHALLRRGHVVFDELRQSIRDIEFLADPTAGEVRVASSELFAAGLLPSAIAEVASAHPGIAVRVTQANTATLDFRELRDRTVDLVIARMHAPLEDETLHVEHLFQDRHLVVAGAGSAWARRRKIALADLVNERWIFPPTRVIRAMIAEAFSAHGLDMPRETVTAGSLLLRKHLLATGGYLDVLPDSVLRYNARAWGLKPLPVDLGVKPRWVAIVTLKNRLLSPVVEVFVEHLRSVARSMFVQGPHK